MTKVKVSEAVGPVLDWMVLYVRTYVATSGKPVLTADLMRKAVANGMASPSTDWTQGGLIIEREEIDLTHICPGTWRATSVEHWFNGPTPLIAAMRCYVVSKLGEEVEVPDEIT